MDETLWNWWIVVGESWDPGVRGEYMVLSRAMRARSEEEARKLAHNIWPTPNEIHAVYGPYLKPLD